jgi:hypothetical protein
MPAEAPVIKAVRNVVWGMAFLRTIVYGKRSRISIDIGPFSP